MALEALCGESRRSLRSENALLFGEDSDRYEETDEFVSAYPNAVDPMKILAPPFVSLIKAF